MTANMRRVLTTLATVIVVVADASAQTYECVPASDDRAIGVRDYIRMLVTGTHPNVVATRDLYHLVAANSGQVSIVTQTSKCQQAGATFEAEVNPLLTAAAREKAAATVSRQMVVIKVHTSRYVITDVNHLSGEWRTAFVTDKDFNVLGSFAY